MPNNQFKQLIKSALIEVLSERQDLFVEIIREALEDFALGRAISEGIENDPVSRDEIFKILLKSDWYGSCLWEKIPQGLTENQG